MYILNSEPKDLSANKSRGTYKSRGAAEAFIRVIYADKSEGEEFNLLILSRRDCGSHDRSSRVNGRRQVKVATRASKAASSSSFS